MNSVTLGVAFKRVETATPPPRPHATLGPLTLTDDAGISDFIGGSITVTITNAGRAAVEHVVLVDILKQVGTASGMRPSLVSAKPSRGSCKQVGSLPGTMTFTCDFGTMKGGESVRLTVNFAPSFRGTVEHIARLEANLS